jgi:hypothetical protein
MKDVPVSPVGMIFFYVRYKIVGDTSPHETVRAYLVNGLDLSKDGIVRDDKLSLVRFDMTTGSVT